MINTNPLPVILYGDYDILSANCSDDRIEEARSYIEKWILDSPGRAIYIGCSCGKDSTLLLQLVFEVLERNNIEHSRVTVNHMRTYMESADNEAFADKYLAKLSELGFKVEIQVTPLHARYPVRTLGVGCHSLALNGVRKCTEMKYSIMRETPEMLNCLTMAGSRGEESAKRAAEKREIHAGTRSSVKIAPLKYIREEDVWGYLRKIGTTKFGITYEELKKHYISMGEGRDGCWICYAGHFNTDNNIARAECRTRLQLLRRDWMGEVGTSYLYYPLQTLMPDSVAGPRDTRNDFYEEWLRRGFFSMNTNRPLAFCMASYEVVKDIERRRGFELIRPEERVFIEDIHKFRYIYKLDNIKRWQMNPSVWCGMNLIDSFDQITKDAVAPYSPGAVVLKKCKGNWFRRHAIEYERRDMVLANEDAKSYCTSTLYMRYDNGRTRLMTQLKESGYIGDENKEPFPGLFAAAEAMGINCHPDFESCELYKRATDRDYRMSIEEDFRKLQKDCYEYVMQTHDGHPELFGAPDGIFYGDNIWKFIKENNL